MSVRLSVLASGSGGNASLLEVDSFRLLLDAGLGPRQLARRLTAAGTSWDRIRAAILTHTHSDHWKEATLAQLYRLRIPLYCHSEHVTVLKSCAPFVDLLAAGLVRLYETATPFPLTNRVHCLPLELSHDKAPTFGFRFNHQAEDSTSRWSVAYIADLGTWDASLAASLSSVDLLALEFNHDVTLQQASGRPQALVDRVLGDFGHLSNDQAAALLREVIVGSPPGRLRHVVQLHLSRQCNRPPLAVQAARAVLDNLSVDVQIHTADQDKTTTIPF